MTPKIIQEITDEQDRQVVLHGEQSELPDLLCELPDLLWLTILTEEVGEVAKECIDKLNGDYETTVNLRKEIVEAVAVGVTWLEALDKRMENL